MVNKEDVYGNKKRIHLSRSSGIKTIQFKILDKDVLLEDMYKVNAKQSYYF